MSFMEWWEGFWATYNGVVFGIGVNAMLALSLYVTLSCGLLSLANAAFMGIGAYTAAILTMNYELSFPLALLVGGTLPALVALVIGIPTLRLSGVYLAMATLGFGEVVRVVALNMDITGGPLGLNGVPPLTDWYHILVLLGITLYVLARIRRSRIGRAFEAIKEDEVAARLMGVNVAGYKLLAFVIGAFIAGVAGGLSAHYTFTLEPANFGFDKAVEFLTMTIFGGVTALAGPVLGAGILTTLPELLRELDSYRHFVNGLILVLVVLYLPRGIWDPRRLRQLRASKATRGGK